MRLDMKKAFYCLLGLTFLQDLSADVTKLRLTQNAINALKHGNTYKGIHFCCSYGDDCLLSDEPGIIGYLSNCIYYNENGEVVIVNGEYSCYEEIKSDAQKYDYEYKKTLACKLQFENIINCLYYRKYNIPGCSINTKVQYMFNDDVFVNPFDGEKTGKCQVFLRLLEIVVQSLMSI